MKIKEALTDGAAQLMGASATPNLDAELILCWVYGWDRIQVILKADRVMQDDDEIKYFESIIERKAGKPVQYIVRKQEFMGLEFYVDERVLIPRPDTEVLVECALNYAKEHHAPKVLDLCTGSGAIAIAIAHYCPAAEVTATDISQEALEVARHNEALLLPQSRIAWRQGNLLEAIAEETETYDVVVSNPPYIPTEDIEHLEANVKNHEPKGALDGGDDGLEFYKILAAGVARRLKKGGLIAFEIGYDQGEAVKALLNETGLYCKSECVKDLAGYDRVVTAEKM